MRVERLNPKCIKCLVDKHLPKAPKELSKEEQTEYMLGILKIISEWDVYSSAPEIVEKINRFKKERFNISSDLSGVKSHFNQLMLSLEKEIEKEIENSDNRLKTAISYAMAGNYIDFGAMQSVEEEKLKAILANAENTKLDACELENFQKEITAAKRIVYLTDNCGEIVLDKLLIKQILGLNSGVRIDVIVRGEPVLNDCTMEDAIEVGLDKLVTVIGNGSAVAGTSLDKISQAARELVDKADVIISKGQGNFETLRHTGKNIYYLFLCKCKMFAERFGVEVLTGMFINDKRMD